MNLDDVLGRATERAVTLTTSTAKQAADLGGSAAVEATGSATRVVDRAARGPAYSVAVLALAAVGGIVAMRFVFSGAIS